MSQTFVVRLRHLLAWCAVVVVTAAVTTVIVTRVGRDVAGDPMAGGSVALPPGLVGTSTPPPTAGPGSGSASDTDGTDEGTGGATSAPGSAPGSPGATPPRSQTPTPGGEDASEASDASTGGADDTAGPVPRGGSDGQTTDAGGPGARTGTSAGRTPAGSPGTATRTFSTPGGAVVAGCRDLRPYARSITPRYGWSFESEAGPRELDVTFKQPGREYPLHVVCRGGAPVLAEGYGSGHE